jgi:hypothetical protein
MDGPRRIDEQNVGYLVLGPPGLNQRIASILRDRFGQAEPFVICWPARR